MLSVTIKELNMNCFAKNATSLIFILSFGKKSAQFQKVCKLQNGKSIMMNDSLTIECDSINIIKHKYCLIFVYEVIGNNNKHVIGNVPINILKDNLKGVKVYTFYECQDTGANLSAMIDLKEISIEENISSQLSMLKPQNVGGMKQKQNFIEKGASLQQDSINQWMKNQVLQDQQNNKQCKIALMDGSNPFSAIMNDLVNETQIFLSSQLRSHIQKDKSLASNAGLKFQAQKRFMQKPPFIQIDWENIDKFDDQQHENKQFNFMASEKANSDVKIQLTEPKDEVGNELLQTFGQQKQLSLALPLKIKQWKRYKIHQNVSFKYIPPINKKYSFSTSLQINKVISICYTGNFQKKSQVNSNQKNRNEGSDQLCTLNKLNMISHRGQILQKRCLFLIKSNQQIILFDQSLRIQLQKASKVTAKAQQGFRKQLEKLNQKLLKMNKKNQQFIEIITEKQDRLVKISRLNGQYVREINQLKSKLKENTEVLHELRWDLDSNLNEDISHFIPNKGEIPMILKSVIQPSWDRNSTFNKQNQGKTSSIHQIYNINTENSHYSKISAINDISHKSGISRGNSSINDLLLPDSKPTVKKIGKVQKYKQQKRVEPNILNKGLLIDFMEGKELQLSIPQSEISIDISVEQNQKIRTKPILFKKKFAFQHIDSIKQNR